VFYGWWLSGVAALVMVLGTVPFFQGMPAWNVALENHFHWSRGQLALAFSLSRVEGSIMGPVAGYLIDKLGPRRMVLVGLLILGAGFLLFSQVRQLWQFYLAFVVMSMGVGLGTWLPMMTALNNWFVRRRSIAMAIAMNGFYIGGVVLVPALAWAIDPGQPDRIGWRATAAAIGLVIIVLAFPISRLVRNRPEDYGSLPDGRPATPRVAGATSPGRLSPGQELEYTWQQALRTRAFWLITMGHACSSIVIVTVTVHLGLMLSDRGFSLPLVGWVVAVYTAVGGVFTMVGGYVGDRVPPKAALFGFSALQSAAIIVLLLAHSMPMALLFAVLLGIGVGGRTPLTTAIRGVYFGRRAFASITGVSMVPMNVLLLLAPWFAGYMFDTTGTYTIPFIVVAVVSGLGSGFFLLLGPPATPAERRPV
jgi:MFS family permease